MSNFHIQISLARKLASDETSKVLNIYLFFRIRVIKVRRIRGDLFIIYARKFHEKTPLTDDKKRGKARIHQIYFTKEQVDLQQRVISILALN